jgi:hypothetical protein
VAAAAAAAAQRAALDAFLAATAAGLKRKRGD